MSIRVGERIRHLRIYRNMSQTELTEGICSVAYLSKVENGKTSPSNQFLKKIAAKLNIRFEMLNFKNAEGFQQEIETILFQIEQEKIVLSKSEESLLRIALLEFIPPQLSIRVFTILLKELIEQGLIYDADLLYESYSKLIDVTNVLKFTNKQEKGNYFRLHSTLGRYYFIKQKFNHSDYHYSISETLIDADENENIETAKLYYNISLVKQRISEDATVALYYSKRSYDIFYREKDLDNLVNIMITMGVQYHLLSKYEMALKTLKEAEEYLGEFQSEKKNALLTMITYNMGRVYQKLKEYDEATLYYNKSSDSTESNIHKVYILKALLEIKLQEKEWLTVKNLLDETFTLAREYKLPYIEIELHSIKATIYKERGDYLNYEKSIKHAIEQAEVQGYSPLLKKMAEDLANYYYELRFYKKSSEYYLIALNNS